jgi:hypothetical protein
MADQQALQIIQLGLHHHQHQDLIGLLELIENLLNLKESLITRTNLGEDVLLQQTNQSQPLDHLRQLQKQKQKWRHK